MKHRIYTETQNQGFTLLEVMIALGILAIGFLAVISLHVAAIQNNEKASRYTEASFSNQSQAEYFILRPYASIDNSGAGTNGYTTVTSSNFPNLYDTVPNGYTLEYKLVQTLDYNSDGTDDAKEISLRSIDSNGDVKSNLTFIKIRN